MTNYYGREIHRNIGKSWIDMKKDIMASFNHIFSSKENQRHGLCPKGEDSWCYFQRTIAMGKEREKIEFKRSSTVSNLDAESERKIKAVYEALSEKELFERCVRGLTQNANESFHSKIWNRAHKTKFAIINIPIHNNFALLLKNKKNKTIKLMVTQSFTFFYVPKTLKARFSKHKFFTFKMYLLP